MTDVGMGNAGGGVVDGGTGATRVGVPNMGDMSHASMMVTVKM